MDFPQHYTLNEGLCSSNAQLPLLGGVRVRVKVRVGGGGLQFLSDGDDQMGQKSKPEKVPAPKNPMPNFQDLKISRRH